MELITKIALRRESESCNAHQSSKLEYNGMAGGNGQEACSNVLLPPPKAKMVAQTGMTKSRVNYVHVPSVCSCVLAALQTPDREVTRLETAYSPTGSMPKVECSSGPCRWSFRLPYDTSSASSLQA